VIKPAFSLYGHQHNAFFQASCFYLLLLLLLYFSFLLFVSNGGGGGGAGKLYQHFCFELSSLIPSEDFPVHVRALVSNYRVKNNTGSRVSLSSKLLTPVILEL